MNGRIDSLIGCSRYITARAKKFAGPRHTIPYGVDTEFFCPSQSNVEGPPRLLYVGKLSPECGLHYLLDALGDLITMQPDVELTLLGSQPTCPDVYELGERQAEQVKSLLESSSGDYKTWLEQVSTPASKERLVFSTLSQPEQLREAYQRANIFVFPSPLRQDPIQLF